MSASLASFVAACALLTDYSLSPSPNDDAADAGTQAAQDGAPGDDASGDGGSQDGGPSDASLDAVVDARPPRVTFAPRGRADGGSRFVDAGGFCIDALEVTQADYDTFLKSAPASRVQIAECAWKTSFVPSIDYNPTGTANRPVVGVDWCDAYAYCAWVGKRLCGRVDGGAIPTTGQSDAAVAQWYAACSNGNDGRVWVYGATYEALRCNGGENVGGAGDVGSYPNCEGGVPGLFDMNGNVAEWLDSCDEQADPKATACARRGGDFNNPPANTNCPYNSPAERSRRDNDTGFRCCVD